MVPIGVTLQEQLWTSDYAHSNYAPVVGKGLGNWQIVQGKMYQVGKQD